MEESWSKVWEGLTELLDLDEDFDEGKEKESFFIVRVMRKKEETTVFSHCHCVFIMWNLTLPASILLAIFYFLYTP